MLVTGCDRDYSGAGTSPLPLDRIMAPKRKAENISDAVDLVDLEDGWMKKLLDIDTESLTSYASFATKDVSRTTASKLVESHSHRSLQRNGINSLRASVSQKTLKTSTSIASLLLFTNSHHLFIQGPSSRHGVPKTFTRRKRARRGRKLESEFWTRCVSTVSGYLLSDLVV